MEYLDSQKTALTASLLLGFAHYPILYSQNGRAYSLTIFMALAMMYATCKLISGRTDLPLWGSVLAALGLGMVLALPSNINFLAALTIFFIVTGWSGQIKSYFSKPVLKKTVPFFFMIALAASYLVVLYPYLKRSLKISEHWEKGARGTLGASADWLPGVLQFIAEPWGFWLYLPFAFAVWILGKEKKLYPFLSMFFTPIALGFISGIFGPPRIYLYWTPLIFIPVALGLVHLQETVEKTSGRVASVAMITVLSLALFAPALVNLKNYYGGQFALVGTKMADARQILAYVRNLIGSRQIIVLDYGDSVLGHYTGQAILENNFRVLNDGELENILFVAHNKVHPWDQRWVGFDLTHLPESFFTFAKHIGAMQVYRYSGTISKLIPAHPDPDFERTFAGVANAEYAALNTPTPRIFGNQSLLIKKKKNTNEVGKDMIKISYGFDISSSPETQGKRYILLAYVKNPYLASAFFRDKGSISLNYSNSFFVVEGSQPVWQKRPPFQFIHRQMGVGSFLPEQYWDMDISLYPVIKEEKFLAFTFHVGEGNTIYDGIQTFSLVDN